MGEDGPWIEKKSRQAPKGAKRGEGQATSFLAKATSMESPS